MRTLSAYIRAMACGNPDCEVIHIVLFDDKDVAFAEATLTDETCRELIKDMQNALYSKAANRSDS